MYRSGGIRDQGDTSIGSRAAPKNHSRKTAKETASCRKSDAGLLGSLEREKRWEASDVVIRGMKDTTSSGTTISGERFHGRRPEYEGSPVGTGEVN